MARATATRQEASMDRPPMAAGIGDSPRFGGTDEAMSAENLSNPRHMANCTINGEPVPEHLWALMPYDLTDQGVAEREAANEGKMKPVVEFLRDELHGKIHQRGADLSRGMKSIDASGVVRQETIERGFEPFDASDPMRELVLEHVPPGMRPKFLSSRLVDKNGSTRGYEIARHPNGDPVRLGTSILGFIPEERAVAIQRASEQKSADAQREIYGEDFDPRRIGRNGNAERAYNKRIEEDFSKQDGLSSGHNGPSHSFENPGPTQGFDVGLQSDAGGDFSLA